MSHGMRRNGLCDRAPDSSDNADAADASVTIATLTNVDTRSSL
jgi:hypothetical protein